MIGFVYCQMFGMRQDQLVNSKIGAAEQARMGFNELANDIRAAKIWQIGNGDLNSFTGIPQEANQRGNALKLSHDDRTQTITISTISTPTRASCSAATAEARPDNAWRRT